ncbi:mitochondrial carrier protein [Fadolivirus algeromassiliense]|jgi:solute carrier family 25 carnitine/acylcarnitine transporter 20/29|uniref:Mitochondrial carrier protein n=1 Tax=Fadolivirus FV1/VV64 TaxID=3070911 RepID=A0A7D3QTT6_9VIRU|nr:mitochondrial carrier protein [Fadolivirus algeromassiliense]QKF93583.1 mitochondrial carrier protein [Fadolivirus FV1/VV64]
MDWFLHFVNGAVSGMVGVTLSHPFDTIKTCIQDGKSISLNPRTLYKGFIPPLFGVGFEKAVVFGTYTNTYTYLNNNSVRDMYAIPLSGGLSGLMASFVVTPVERIKILLQTNHKIDYKSINRQYLFRGLSATFTRETPGFAIYFSVYESMKNKFYTNQNKEITKAGSFLFGGLAGAVAWVFIFPQDCIKTRMQANTECKKSFGTVLREIYMEGGLRQFYKGFHFALMRAVPLHAGTFMTMELMRKWNS